MNSDFRCSCPFTSFLDLFGDRWSLVVLKLMLIEKKKTFKEFVESDEGFATNILSDRLKQLEQRGYIEKLPHPQSKKSNIYRLTEKGLSLSPVIIQIAVWGYQNLKKDNPAMPDFPMLEQKEELKSTLADHMVKSYRQTYNDKSD